MLKNYTILINSPNCQFLHSNQFSKYFITFLSKFHMKFFIDSLTLNNFFTNLNWVEDVGRYGDQNLTHLIQNSPH